MKKDFTYRLLEILPGFLSWNIILFPIWGSFFVPFLVAYIVFFFDVFWLYRAVIMAFNVVVVHFKMRSSEGFDWLNEARGLQGVEKVHHLVIVPNVGEPLHILQRTVEALANQDFPLKQISLIWATELREGVEAVEKFSTLSKQYGYLFANFLLTQHSLLPGEVKGKSSNEAWAIKEADRLIVEKDKLDPDLIVVTTCDADVCFHPKYFSALTVSFLLNPKRYMRFWQGAVLFYNNIWKIPFPGRVTNSIGTVWNMAMLQRSDRLVNFSTYSLSFKMLKGVGFWDSDVIPEDWRIFFKCFYHYNGEVEVEPIFLPLFADAAEAKGFWPTMYNQYKQYQRWAWGVSDEPLFLRWWMGIKTRSFLDKSLRMLKALEYHLLWPTQWFFLTLGITLPVLLSSRFAKTVLSVNLLYFSSLILSVCLVFLLIMLLVDFARRPNPPGRLPHLKKILHYLEFAFIPVIGFFFGALPGLDAHTRLMLGKYLEYRVTEKV